MPCHYILIRIIWTGGSRYSTNCKNDLLILLKFDMWTSLPFYFIPLQKHFFSLSFLFIHFNLSTYLYFRIFKRSNINSSLNCLSIPKLFFFFLFQLPINSFSFVIVSLSFFLNWWCSKIFSHFMLSWWFSLINHGSSIIVTIKKIK